jgi:Cdc6-like AAA superfamily ATPase
MAELWYEKLGFFENPFSIKPIHSNEELFGYDKEIKEVISLIKQGEIFIIKGDFGLGKTTIIKHIIDRFGGKKKLIYCSCNRYNNDLDVENLIIGAGSLYSRLIKKKKRNLILLLDEIQDLSRDEINEVFEAYMDNFFKSIVMISADDITLPKEIEKKVKKEIVLKGIDEEHALSIVKNRLDGLGVIDEKIVKKVFNISGGNPRVFLSNCEDVCKHAFDLGDEKVTEKHLEIIK